MRPLLHSCLSVFLTKDIAHAAALFLSDYASYQTRRVVKPILEILAGIPTVVLGLFGLYVINPKLVENMLPTLVGISGKEGVSLIHAHMGAEDFSYFQEKTPGFFFFLGARPADKKVTEVAAHHTPDFYLDESKFQIGVKALSHLVVDYFDQAMNVKKFKK